MNMHDTLYMLAAIEELPLEHTFFKDRYFPTDDVMDVFNTSKVLADYREGSRKKAPFVMPRIGSLPVGREGFSTFELEPAYIGLSMPLTLDQLKNVCPPDFRFLLQQHHDQDRKAPVEKPGRERGKGV